MRQASIRESGQIGPVLSSLSAAERLAESNRNRAQEPIVAKRPQWTEVRPTRARARAALRLQIACTLSPSHARAGAVDARGGPTCRRKVGLPKA